MNESGKDNQLLRNFKDFIARGQEPEESDDQIERRQRRMHDSLIVTYALAPEAPENVGTFLSADKQPVYQDYDKLPWKQLAQDLQKQLDALGVPKNIKAFVGTDAIDILDLMDMKRHEGYDPIVSASKYIMQMRYEDFRGGLMQLNDGESFHGSPRKRSGRTPPAAIFVGFRFNNMYQTNDYLSGITQALFGTADSLLIQPGQYTTRPLPDVIKNWVESACGVVTGNAMDMYRTGLVYRGDSIDD